MELIALLIGIWLIYLFIVYVIPFIIRLCVTIGGAAMAIAAGAAALVGLYIAIKHYILAIRKHINFRSWTWKQSDEPAQRSYFFGPGYVQLWNTVCEAFRGMNKDAQDLNEKAEDVGDWDDGFWGWCLKILSWIYRIAGCICIYGFGTVLGLTLALMHGSVTTVVMLTIYVIFMATWLIDGAYLMRKRIRSVCPVCKARYRIPMFMCGACGAKHYKLVPGPYGIFHHRCTCGESLPCTFLNGRSALEAYCPDCESSLVASDARPVVFQLAGGTRSGKTVYLSSLFHGLRARLDCASAVTYQITDAYRPYFDELEEWYSGVPCPVTNQLNAQMYPLLIQGLDTRRQLAVFDIAGEMFNGTAADGELAQQQFTYCDGLLLVIDPFCGTTLRQNRERTHQRVADFSDMPTDVVVTNFIQYMIRIGHLKATARCTIPLAVLITKADEPEVRKNISPARINAIYKKNPDAYASRDAAQDEVCRQFLLNIGLNTAVNDLETQFSNIHYYPVSAQGHSTDGTPFEPWGVMEAVDWMLPLADNQLADVLCR